MEIYHWILLIFFSLPYFSTKIYNEIRYNKEIYWYGMNKAEIVLSILPIILSILTIRKYKIYDYQNIAYTISLIALFLHSAFRYEKVRAIIEEQEMEPKIPEKKVTQDYFPGNGGRNNREPSTTIFDYTEGGGGGGSEYIDPRSNTYPNYTFYNSQGYGNNIANAYEIRRNSFDYDYAKFTAIKQESGFNGTLYNYARNKNLDEITILIKKVCPTVKIGYDDGGCDYTKAGLVYDMGGGAKLKYTDYLDYWYVWDNKKEMWIRLIMNEETMKVLKEAAEGKL